MAIISAFTLIRFLSLFHITAAYFLLTTPRTLTETSLVQILGASMHLSPSSQLVKPSEGLALAAFLLAFLGVSDLTAASMPDLPALEYWASQTPVRIVLLFGITAYTYLFSDEGFFGRQGGAMASLVGKAGPGQYLRNDFVFTVGFLEATMWFYVYVLLGEEKKKLAEKIREKRKLEADML